MKFYHIQWFDQVYSITSTEFLIRDFSDLRIQMYRINNLHICKFLHDLAYSPEHITHGFSQIFPSVCCHSNQSAVFCPFCFRVIKIISHRIVQSINSCISCDKNLLWILTLFQQCIRCFLGRCKMQAGSKSNGLPVKFFRIGRFHIISTKSRFLSLFLCMQFFVLVIRYAPNIRISTPRM